tara:strand:+ start:1276 stop:1689 length:414 start_codon:yes stop_codon:yes gene_type:complete
MEKEIINLSKKICNEHYKITDSDDCRNLNYLWYMYVDGLGKNTFKPFVFLAELKLLEYLKYIEKNNLENAINMLNSSDKENMYVVSQVISFYRKKRIKDLGECVDGNANYDQVKKDYEFKILNKSVWSDAKKIENND